MSPRIHSGLQTVFSRTRRGFRYCEAEIPSGETEEGWRLPNINELSSLLSHERNYPATDFPYTETAADTFWSSTAVSHELTSSFTVDFTQGYVWTSTKTGTLNVRCVRGGP